MMNVASSDQKTIYFFVTKTFFISICMYLQNSALGKDASKQTTTTQCPTAELFYFLLLCVIAMGHLTSVMALN